MRILAVENEPSSKLGGQEHSLVDACVGLSARGHDVVLAHTSEGDLLPRYHAAGVRTAPMMRYTIDRTRPMSSAAGLARSLARAVALRPDVIYINQYLDVFFAGMLARLLARPLVCHLRLYPPDFFCGQWRLGLPSVTRFIAVSQVTRDAYVGCGFNQDAIDLVYNGIDVARFRPDAGAGTGVREDLGIAPDAFVATYAGRINRSKNLELLLRGFAGLGLPPARGRLLIAGRLVVYDALDGERYLEELGSLARELGIEESVHWLGSRGDMPAVLAASDASVLVGREPETFGRVIAESLSCGVPAVGVRRGGIPEILAGEFERLLVSDEPRDLTDRLHSLIGWRDRDPDFSRRAHEYVASRFSAERMVEGIESSLRRAVADDRPRGPSLATLKRANSIREDTLNEQVRDP